MQETRRPCLVEGLGRGRGAGPLIWRDRSTPPRAAAPRTPRRPGDRRARRRRPAELREDGPADRGAAPRAAPRAGRRPHRPALRPQDVRGDPRRSRLPGSRPLARRRLRHPRRADRQGADRVRADPARGAPGARRRRRRRQLDARLRARRGEAAASRSPTSRPACARATGRMPEEINRVLTDRLSDVLLTHSPEAEENLAREGVDTEPRPLRRQHDDRLAAPLRARARASRAAWTRARRAPSASTCSSRCTARRTSTTRRASAGIVDGLLRARRAGADRLPDPPAHARAAGRGRRPRAARGGRACAASSRSATSTSCRCRPAPARSSPTPAASRRRPSALGVPCYTLRANTERPVTITHGTNVLLGDDPASLLDDPDRVAPADAVRDPAVGRPRGRPRRGRARSPTTRARGRDSGAATHDARAPTSWLRDRPARHGPRRSTRVEQIDRRRAASRSTWRSTRPSS